MQAQYLAVIQKCNGAFSESVPDSIFYATDLSGAYFPGRGVLASTLIHVTTAFVLLFFPALRLFLFSPPMPEDVVFINLREPVTVMYLPSLDGGKQAPQPAKVAKAAPERKAPPPVAEGLSYPSPQPILSDVPDPTNRVQTVLKPEVSNLPTLKPPLPIPNLVQAEEKAPVIQKIREPEVGLPETELWTHNDLPELADYLETVLQPVPLNIPSPEPEVVLPEIASPVVQNEEPVPEPEMELPEMKLESLSRRDTAELIPLPSETSPIEARPPSDLLSVNLPDLIKVTPPPPLPVPEREITEEQGKEPEKIEELASAPPGTVPHPPEDEAPYLALTPLPALPAIKIDIPEGEARGSFALSPRPNLATDALDPGGRSEDSAEKTGPPQTAAEVEVAESEEEPLLVLATGAAPESGDDFGAIPVSDAFEGITIIGGAVEPADASHVAGDVVEDPFGGISIVGGSYEPGVEDEPAVIRAHRPLQTEYSLNVISTEDSGGGLPSYGVFQDEQIYTTYLDMRETESDQDPSWTLEFARLRESDGGVVVNVDWENNNEGLILPFPKVKERPYLPDPIIRSCSGGLIVVYGVIDREGHLKQLTIKESPHELLSQLVLQALGKWIFRPARFDGEPVAVKVLMGIPLWLPSIE